jgi:8-oxo-dGTP pyrophosphatase MutT (NUDIX family)
MPIINDSWYHRPPNTPARLSAGGIVARAERDTVLIALVHENEYPGMVIPKGGVEPGENLEAAARREIAEEAGLTGLELVAELGVCERLNFTKTSWGVTHYFLFRASQPDGKPTDSHHDYRVEWHPIRRLPAMMWPEQQRLIELNRVRIETEIVKLR